MTRGRAEPGPGHPNFSPLSPSPSPPSTSPGRAVAPRYLLRPGRVPPCPPPPPRHPVCPTRVPHRPFVELVSFIYYNTESYIKFAIKRRIFLTVTAAFLFYLGKKTQKLPPLLSFPGREGRGSGGGG